MKKKQEETSKTKTEDKFNNTNVYDSNNKDKIDYSEYDTNNNQGNVMNDEDIKEEIITEVVNNDPIDNITDKQSSVNSIHNYTSSQTFGYDNSVTSYNLDYYDYVEEIEKT